MGITTKAAILATAILLTGTFAAHSVRADQPAAGRQRGAGGPALGPGLTACSNGLCAGYDDDANDHVVRRMVPGNNDQPVSEGKHPDLIHYRVGNWLPNNVNGDLFQGQYSATDFDEYVRIDMVFRGKMNPPGPQVWDDGTQTFLEYDPYRYGPSPLYGSIEVDADANPNTGAELAAPYKYFLGNVGRFGSRAMNGMASRTAGNWADVISAYDTPPQVKRLGSEFQLELKGDEFTDLDINVKAGDGDLIFEQNEIWEVTGFTFERSQGYEFAAHWGSIPCDGPCKKYAPVVTLRFQHRKNSCQNLNETIVSVIVPLKNLNGEPDDFDEFNDFSIYEALTVPAFHTVWNLSGDPEDDMLMSWMGHVPDEYIQSRFYGLRMLFATSYKDQPTSKFFDVWTDYAPNTPPGDFNGDSSLDVGDLNELITYINDHDGQSGFDDDGNNTNQIIDVANFPVNFSVYDTNYDGVVEKWDVFVDVYGDMDGSGIVDGNDIQGFTNCQVLGLDMPTPELRTQYYDLCRAADMNDDFTINLADYAALQRAFGP